MPRSKLFFLKVPAVNFFKPAAPFINRMVDIVPGDDGIRRHIARNHTGGGNIGSGSDNDPPDNVRAVAHCDMFFQAGSRIAAAHIILAVRFFSSGVL